MLQQLSVAAARLETNALLRWVRENVTALLPADSFYIALHDPKLISSNCASRWMTVHPYQARKRCMSAIWTG